MALDLTISTGRFSRSSSEPASRQFESNYTNINQSILTGASTTVTYFIWHPNMVALGAISSKLSLTSRDNPVRCVRGDMLNDFDS